MVVGSPFVNATEIEIKLGSSPTEAMRYIHSLDQELHHQPHTSWNL